MHRGHRSVVAGVHGLEHVEGLRPAALADDDPVGPHPQGVSHQIPDGILPGPLHVGRLAFQGDHVLLVEAQLHGVFDGDDPLLEGDEAAEHVQKRRLARARPAADQHVAAVDHARPQERGAGPRDAFHLDQVVHGEALDGELADRQARPFGRQGGNDGVDPGAVGEPGVDQRLALVDPAAHLGHDPLDDRLGHLVGDEPPPGTLDHPVPLHVDLIAVDDHDLGHRGGPQQVFQGPEAEDRVLEILLERAQDQVLAELVV